MDTDSTIAAQLPLSMKKYEDFKAKYRPLITGMYEFICSGCNQIRTLDMKTDIISKLICNGCIRFDINTKLTTTKSIHIPFVAKPLSKP